MEPSSARNNALSSENDTQRVMEHSQEPSGSAENDSQYYTQQASSSVFKKKPEPESSEYTMQQSER
jgi:hypothetical protein